MASRTHLSQIHPDQLLTSLPSCPSCGSRPTARLEDWGHIYVLECPKMNAPDCLRIAARTGTDALYDWQKACVGPQISPEILFRRFLPPQREILLRSF